MIRERMPQLEEIDNGKILIHGSHTINNIIKRGTYLVLFNKTISIDDQNFINEKDLILEYLRRNKPTRYEILDVIESQNEKLKIPTMTIMEKIPIEMEAHPIASIVIFVIIFIIFVIIMHYLKFVKFIMHIKCKGKRKGQMITYKHFLIQNWGQFHLTRRRVNKS